jgi:hypothetical protein
LILIHVGSGSRTGPVATDQRIPPAAHRLLLGALIEGCQPHAGSVRPQPPTVRSRQTRPPPQADRPGCVAPVRLTVRDRITNLAPEPESVSANRARRSRADPAVRSGAPVRDHLVAAHHAHDTRQDILIGSAGHRPAGAHPERRSTTVASLPSRRHVGSEVFRIDQDVAR